MAFVDALVVACLCASPTVAPFSGQLVPLFVLVVVVLLSRSCEERSQENENSQRRAALYFSTNSSLPQFY
jgi:hypothetical protein